MMSMKGKRYEFKVEYDSYGHHKNYSKFFLREEEINSLVDMIETAEPIPDQEDAVRIVLKLSSDPSSKEPATQATSSQSSEISSKSKRFYSPSPNSKQNSSQKRFRSKRNLNDNHEDNSRPALINLCDYINQSSVVEDEPVGFEYPNF